MLGVGITGAESDLALLSLIRHQKLDVGAVDPNGDIVTGVAGAGVNTLSGPKLGAVAGSTQPLAAKSGCVAPQPSLLRGKLVRQRIGISRNPRRMQRVHTAHLVLMRVSHHRQRPAG